jgi:hypothetical protein
MNINFYPETLRSALEVIEALDRLDRELESISDSMPAPYFKGPIKLVDSDGAEYGEFTDEIGGAWSWWPNGTGETSNG